MKDKTLRIIVENKVCSREQADQAKKYHDYYTEYHKGDDLIFVFLTLHGDDKCSCEKFIQISYQDLYDSVLLPLKQSEQIPPEKRYLINEYILALTQNYKSKKDIMVMTEDLKVLLNNFLTENEEIIQLAQSLNDEQTATSRKTGRKGGKSISSEYYTVRRSVSDDGLSNQHVYRIMRYSNNSFSLDHREYKYGGSKAMLGQWEEFITWNSEDSIYPTELRVDYLPSGNYLRKDYVVVIYNDGTEKKLQFNTVNQKNELLDYYEE